MFFEMSSFFLTPIIDSAFWGGETYLFNTYCVPYTVPGVFKYCIWHTHEKNTQSTSFSLFTDEAPGPPWLFPLPVPRLGLSRGLLTQSPALCPWFLWRIILQVSHLNMEIRSLVLVYEFMPDEPRWVLTGRSCLAERVRFRASAWNWNSKISSCQFH